MRSRLFSCLASLLAALALCVPAAAQNPNAPPGQATGLASPAGPPPLPVFEYTLAFIASAGVLVLVCMPARRS